MDKYTEHDLRQKYEQDRITAIAERLLYITGARTIIITRDENEKAAIQCSTGRVESLKDYVGDALADCNDLDQPLRDLV